VAVAWIYTGMNPEELEGRITTVYEKVLTTVVENIQHIESTTINGIVIVKLFMQLGASIDRANAQVTAGSQTILRQLPPGTLPPLIVNYNASSVPILQLSLSGRGLSEMNLNDLAQNFLRPQLVTVPGAAVPYAYGGLQRQIMVNLDSRLLQSKRLSPQDIVTTLSAQNVIAPSGTVKINQFEYDIGMNSAPRTVEELNGLPIKVVGNSTIYLRDVCRIDEINSAVQGQLNHARSVFLGKIAHVHFGAELHAAQRDFADDNTGIAQLSVLHRFSSLLCKGSLKWARVVATLPACIHW
jgi:multidrug efflux pump subunit AcrB